MIDPNILQELIDSLKPVLHLINNAPPEWKPQLRTSAMFYIYTLTGE